MARNKTGARLGITGWLARVAAAAFLAWFAGFIAFVLLQAPPAPDGVTTDGVAVLTGGPKRLKRGIAVLEAGLAKRLLVSGVDPKVRPPELVAEAGISPRLFTCCIDLGFEAKTTRTNAEEVAAWVERHRFRSIRLVTAGYHMHRAREELAAKLPPEVTIVPDGVSAGLPLIAMHREYVKLLGSWVTLRARPK